MSSYPDMNRFEGRSLKLVSQALDYLLRGTGRADSSSRSDPTGPASPLGGEKWKILATGWLDGASTVSSAGRRPATTLQAPPTLRDR